MRILGPLVCSSTSPVTATFSRSFASEVTFAPSTTRATGSETLAPGSESSFSTLTTSPTATLYCLPPVLTIAYVAIVPLRSSLGARYLSERSRCFGAEPRRARCRRLQPKDNWSRVREARLQGQITAGHGLCTVRLAGYHRSPAGLPARFQLQDTRGVIRLYRPGPTMPTSSTGGSASPYTRSGLAVHRSIDLGASTTSHTLVR